MRFSVRAWDKAAGEGRKETKKRKRKEKKKKNMENFSNLKISEK
jgi:hypothetical protein